MRGHWVVIVLAVILSMGTMVVLVGQYQQLVKIQTLNHRKEQDLGLMSDRAANNELFLSSFEKQGAQSAKEVQELEKVISQVRSEDDKKKKEVEECQAVKKTINDEIAAKTKENEDFKAKMQSESEAWKKEIASLQEQLKGYSHICRFVRDDPLAQKLCGITPTTTTLAPTVTTTTVKAG